MKFIDSYNAKLQERNNFIAAKTAEIKTNEANVNKCKEVLEASKVEYYKGVTDITLKGYKDARIALEEAEKALSESKADLRQLSMFFYFIYDSETLINECKDVYNDSGINEDLEDYISLMQQVEALKKTIEDKWEIVEREVCNATYRISSLYLTLKEREALSGSIDEFMNSKLYALTKQKFRGSHHSRGHHELKNHAIEKL